MHVTKIIKERNGVSLAETNNGKYAVGILYTIGEPLNSPMDGVDFGVTDSLSAATVLWEKKAGSRG